MEKKISDSKKINDIIAILTNENSKKVLLSLLKSEKTAQELSNSLKIPLSTIYRILGELEENDVIKVSRMILDLGGHHSKIYRVKFGKAIVTIDSEGVDVHLILNETDRLIDIWKKLRGDV